MASEATARETRAWRIGRAAAGALGLIFAVVYLVEGRNLALGRMGAPGPGVFPLVVGILFALVSIAVIADALLTRRAGRTAFPEGQNLRRIALVFGIFVAYVSLLTVLGFLIATAVLVTLYTRLASKVSWLWAAASGVGVTFAVWMVFAFFLGVRLPAGIWS